MFRVPRSISAILADIQALNAAQQAAVWADITSGSPPRWRGSNDPVIWCKASQPAASTLEKQVALAFWVLSAPGYLVNPIFDPTINVPGDMPSA